MQRPSNARPASRSFERRPGMVHGSRVTTERRPDRARLARLIRSRRLQLRYDNQEDLAAVARVSKATIGKVEQGIKVSEKTYAALELALQWIGGSIDHILAGGDPTELVYVSASDSASGTDNAVVDVRKASTQELASLFMDLAKDHTDAELMEVMLQVAKLRQQQEETTRDVS